MLKKVLFAASTSVAFCGAAVAADIPARKAPASVYTNPAPVSMWDGFYVGVHGGYASSDVDIFLVAPGSGSPNGGFGGFQIGYNYLFTPNWLLGAEVDASFGSLRDNTSPSPANFKIDAFGTIRGRLGYVYGPWLFYGTAGTAWAKSELNAAGGFITADRTNVGWTAGGGLEYAFAPNWSAKAEYLYADFGETRRSFPFVGNLNTDLTMSMVRLGLNYRFGTFGNVERTSAMPSNAPMRTAVNWTGPYIGLHGGFGSGDFHSTTVFGSTNFDPNGGFGGIQAGYNWQFAPNWVIGMETDSSWGSLKDSSGGDYAKIDEMSTARGRFGYAMNNVLIYGTGGLALAHLDSTTAVGAISADHYLLGWTAGAGVEYKFAPRWSAKVEYAYADFGSVTEQSVGPIAVTDKLDVQTIKVGLNYQASLLNLFVNR